MSAERTNQKGVLAIFEHLDDTCDAIKKMSARKDCKAHEVYAPTSYHELIELAEERYGPSQVRWFTLTGALTGVTTGFGMPLWMDYDWPIIVGGKLPGVYSLPAYFIFGFELMILFGAIATIMGMLVMGRIPNPKSRVLEPRTTDDQFAIFLPDMDLSSEPVKLLKNCGACEVRVV